ncbi:MAG TPA: hypothetical protein PLY52_02620 [Methanothrix sp.]|uniref:hypothetical protein n=1 Tax=Methanothrix sp. TaxID=90426 RepID=UPI002CEFDFE7|nr:hypothetical protein [Methanothrix sp.]MDI9417357.1 hypothetical protein [Euryarchaeota archaeon]HON35190.1 hypothetical protein [Methanothrix sp.]HRU75566.1 hypothetical protein [Methanothrix sp.]
MNFDMVEQEKGLEKSNGSAMVEQWKSNGRAMVEQWKSNGSAMEDQWNAPLRA